MLPLVDGHIEAEAQMTVAPLFRLDTTLAAASARRSRIAEEHSPSENTGDQTTPLWRLIFKIKVQQRSGPKKTLI
jgi:hypothetical protein